MINSEYLEKLNKFQKEAVLHTSGPLLIVAGAGSGKTKTTIASLIEYNRETDFLKNNFIILFVVYSNRGAKTRIQGG